MLPRPLLLLPLLAALLSAGERRSAPGISADRLLAHIERLASDAWEGRASGSAGEREATAYIADQFEEFGLEPAGDREGSFFQGVEMAGGFSLGKACGLALAGPDAGWTALTLDKDFRPFSASASAGVEAEAVFAGYGVSAPDLGYDDYGQAGGVDLTGKVVFVFRHLPPLGGEWAKPAARGTHAPFLAKLKRAADLGAAALVVVNDPASFPSVVARAKKAVQGARARARPDALVRRSIGGVQKPRIPFVHLTLGAARSVFPILFGATPEELESAIRERRAPVSRAGLVRVRVEAQVERETLHGRNVCALLRSTNPAALDEYLVVGGHHDHLGRGQAGSLARSAKERKEVHNGADDNASGTAGVLALAEHLASRRRDLRRNVLFLTFTGEERGLLGSRHFVEHPTVPFDKVVAMINMDMIGRLDGRTLFVGGVKTSPVFKEILERVNAGVGAKVYFGEGGQAPSDNTSFYRKKKPVLFFFTGLHLDYHRPSDDTGKVDRMGIEQVARLAAGVAEELALLEERPAFQRADSGGFGPPRAILGISLARAEVGARIRSVLPGGPAAKAGLAVGDVIVEVAGQEIPDLVSLYGVMRDRKIGERIAVKVLRQGREQLFEVTLARG